MRVFGVVFTLFLTACIVCVNVNAAKRVSTRGYEGKCGDNLDYFFNENTHTLRSMVQVKWIIMVILKIPLGFSLEVQYGQS